MKKLLIFILGLFSFFPSYSQEVIEDNGIPSIIRSFLESTSPEDRPEIDGEELFSSVVIHRFYGERNFMPAWTKNAKLLEIAYEMRYEIGQSKYDGLIPDDYHLGHINLYFDKIESFSKEGQKASLADLAALDVLLTDAYVMLSSHLNMGKVDPESLKATWNIQRNSPELRIDLRLEYALVNESIRKSFEELYPSFSIYKNMRYGLRQLFDDQSRFESEQVATWKSIKTNKTVKPGESDNIIPEIRNRLYFWEFLQPYETDDEKIYDSIMESGIKKLQKRHGMESDGIIGQGTIRAANMTPEDLIITASVNMERLRWLPDSIKDQEVILVNIANYQLDYIQKKDTILTSRVIVGKSYHSTPQFNTLMSYLVFSPTWTVPSSITRNEIVPAIKKDNQYLAKKNMTLLTSSGTVVDPNTIDWNKTNPRNFPYIVRQEPGTHNSLGLVKFMFPNKYSVYIHDTPARSLFQREDRALSHGCIRLQKSFELAKLLLSFDPNWTDEKIQNAMRQSKEQTVMLDRKILVVILYLTYWTDGVGNQYFRQDIYDRNSEIITAIRKRGPKLSGV
ncbi:L,D-transpeptidase family protein [Aquiflexum lacus]|uniref:L,D-transpeptidase family protein n=1 Tax=Aquiflexum lacus TaxID=2483805 RepID=UPI0018932FE6|nr:L,D-transpeptidase family protein [Aquiflexum lacus]